VPPSPLARFRALSVPPDDPAAVICIETVEAGPRTGDRGFDPELVARQGRGKSRARIAPVGRRVRIRLLISMGALFVKVTAKTQPAATRPTAMR